MTMSMGWEALVSRCGWALPGLFCALLSVEVSAAACTAQPYKEGVDYQQGDQVQNIGRQFECWKDSEAPVGSWQWCRQRDYNPGLPASNGAVIWPDAWKDLGECGGYQGNRLTLNFTTLSGRGPISQPTAGVAGADQLVTGVLRCKAEEIPINARSGETIHLDNLKACDYQLVMNVANGFVPLNTPRIVSFRRDEGEEQSITLKYRPPVQVGKLSGLPGIKIELFAQGLIQPRQMAMGKNVLYVGSSAIPSYVYDGKIADMVYALPLDSSGKPTGIYVIASGLEEPHGVVYRDGDLYYSTTGGLYRLRDADEHYKNPSPELVFKFPADDSAFPLPSVASGSSTRFWHMKHPLHFNPLDPADKGLYTAVGIPCNLCMIPADPRYGTLLRYDTVTGKAQILAKGVRNSVGFDWKPKTGDIWFTDNNRQGYPNPDEINRISGPDQHFGVPYFFGKATLGFTDEEFRNPGVIQPPLVQGAIVSDKSLQEVDPKDYVPAAFELGMEETLPPIGECSPLELESVPFKSAAFRNQVQASHHQVVATALACGITRVATIQVGRSAESLNILDVSDVTNPHDCAHRYAGLSVWKKSRQWYTQRVKLFMDELARHADPDVPGDSLLKHTLVVFTSEMADGAPEHTKDMPLVLMGGASGLLKSGNGAGRYFNITAQGDRQQEGNPVIGNTMVDMQRVWATIAKAVGTSVPYAGNVDPVSGIFTNV